MKLSISKEEFLKFWAHFFAVAAAVKEAVKVTVQNFELEKGSTVMLLYIKYCTGSEAFLADKETATAGVGKHTHASPRVWRIS